jgi:hypothetical protein
MMSKRFFLSLLAVFLLAALYACGSSPPDEITPLYQEYPVEEFPFEESAESEPESVPPDDAVQEPLVEESLVEEPLVEEPSAQESAPEVIEDEGLLPEEILLDEERETLESLRETVEALRETVEALREALETLREAPPPEPTLPPVTPPAPEPTPPPVTPPAPEPTPPPVTPPAPEPTPPLETPPVTEPPPPPEPTPQPPTLQPILEPPTPEPLPPELPTPAPEPPPPVPPPEPPSFLGPAEPLYPPLAREPVPVVPPPEVPERATQETSEEEIIFSRIVRVTVGQILEIPFRGTGWVYLGELGNRRGINYESRRLDLQPGGRIGQETVEGQSFIFSVERAGTYILRFYRQDFIQDYIINDNIQVIAGERDENTWRTAGDRVIAEPRWPAADAAAAPVVVETAERPAAPTQAIPPAAATPPEASPSVIAPEEMPPVTAPATAPPPVTPPIDSPAEYVRRARAEFDAGRIESALGILDSFRQNYPGGTDDAWWLYGQLLEANSPSRDIRMSLEYYRRLVNEFPFSDLVEDARSRIAYLERYYFNIR